MREPVVPTDPLALRQAFGCFATGVTVVTSRSPDGNLVGVTANSLTSVSLEPALLLVSLSCKLKSLPVFTRAGLFAVNVLGRRHEETARRFAVASSDKWRETLHSPGVTGAPILNDAETVFECETSSIVPAGDHQLFIGRIVSAWMMAGDGPLISHRGRFTTTAMNADPLARERPVH
jgi:flavin-dependent trigonelline monooxygenase, reductase component